MYCIKKKYGKKLKLLKSIASVIKKQLASTVLDHDKKESWTHSAKTNKKTTTTS